MSEEEVMFEIRENLEDAYRLTSYAQIVLFALAEFLLVLGIYYLRIGLPEAYIVWILATTMIYPVVIKIRNFVSELIAITLYGAAISITAAYLIDKFVIEKTVGVNLWIVVIFLLILGVELFHHVYEKARAVKTKTMIIVDLVLTLIFAYAAWNLMQILIPGNFFWEILTTVMLSVAYFVAIFPEKPF